MDKYLPFDNNEYSNSLKKYFKNNIKLTLKTNFTVIVITKNDLFYEINNLDNKIHSFILNNENSRIESTIVEELSHKGIAHLTYGLLHYFARTFDNKIYCWGHNGLGQFGNGKRYKIDIKDFNKPELNEWLSDLNIDSIKCGCYHSLALTQTGEVYAWGWNICGQIGNNSFKDQMTPIQVNGFNNERVIMISCGSMHSMALTEKGHVFSWGYNGLGQLGLGNEENSNTPKQIELKGVSIEKISCGQCYSLLLSNEGVIYSFGNNDSGQIGNGNNENQTKPTKLNHEKRFKDIASHFNSNISLALSVDNIYYIWGDCGEDNIETPLETKFRSFNEIYAHYYDCNLEASEELISFSD